MRRAREGHSRYPPEMLLPESCRSVRAVSGPRAFRSPLAPSLRRFSATTRPSAHVMPSHGELAPPLPHTAPPVQVSSALPVFADLCTRGLPVVSAQL